MRGAKRQLHETLTHASKHSDAVKKCTQYLTPLGITYLCYVLIKDNGDSSFLTTHPGIEEFYFDNELYKGDIGAWHPQNYQTGFFLLQAIDQQAFDAAGAIYGRHFDVAPVINFARRGTDGTEFYLFWGNPHAAYQLDGVLTNYAKLLKPFIAFFDRECRDIAHPDIAPVFSAPELAGHLFTSNPLKETRNAKIRDYLRNIGLSDEVAQAEELSPREKECIRLLLRGKSAKETGALLNLSCRTVEHYLDNVKLKFHCHYKHELFSIAEKLDDLLLI